MPSIGTTRCRASTIFQQFGLAPFREILPPEEFAAAARQAGCDPQRRRPLIPEVVAWLMMYVGLHTTSMTQGLLQAWGLVRTLCPGLQEEGVTEEAFCQNRRRMPLTFWHELWNRLRRRYEQRFSEGMLWKSLFRVLAIDGSTVNLPNVPALVRFFTRPGGRSGESKQPQGRVVALCSVFTGFCLAFKFVSLRITEHHALKHLIRRLRRNDLVLMDRGFFSLRRPVAHSPARGALPLAGF